jgi:hypothetical protein
MLMKNSSSFEIEDDSSSILDYIPSPPIFLPRTDHNINLFLKSHINKFIDISLPKNGAYQDNKKKEENVFDSSNTSISENLFKLSQIAIDNKINGIIELEEPEIPTINKDILNNSLNKNVSKNSLSEGNNQIKDKKKIFLTVYPKKISLFTKPKIDIDFSSEKADNELLGNKRRRNKEDDIRRMIGRRFFNDILLNLINSLLKESGSAIIFEKIQQDVVYDLVKKNNKKLLDLSLEQIFVKKELYRGKNMEKYYHNLKLINLLKSEEYFDIRQNTQIDRILNMKYYELYEEYISSNEFIEEINRLKNNKTKFDDSYVEKYIYYSFNFIKNFI